MRNNYLTDRDPDHCYGCSICEARCPIHAITMAPDDRGFYYPQVDDAACIDCGICNKVCPYDLSLEYDELKNDWATTELPAIYQVACKNTEALLKSQSGGAFTALSDYVLNQNGVVYGASLCEDLAVRHIRAENAATRDRMHGSKYVQSRISVEIWSQLRKDLKEGRSVLFTGTPCQCAAAQKNYGSYENLIVCDFICHGVPSPQVWERYLKHVADKHHITIQRATFRNKRCRGIGNYTESYYSEIGEEYLENDYAALFYSHLAHRDSCFSCQFTQVNRYADITIGGFLEPSDFETPYDSSMVIPNTEKGKQVFEEIKDLLDWKESHLTHYKNQPCLYHPVPRPENCEKFWADWKTLDIEEILERYATDEIKTRFKIHILRPEG